MILSGTFEMIKNMLRNNIDREIVHTPKVTFRAMIPTNMRTGSARKSFDLKQIVRHMIGKETKC